MPRIYIEGIGIFGPGLNGWPDSAPVLAGQTPYRSGALMLPTLDLLPPAERRRTTPTIKLALSVAEAAVRQSGRSASSLSSIFASSGGDGDTIHAILETLATAARDVSPTRFHNSVHNAPSGYWAIATKCRAPSTTVCAHDCSFVAGLLEAAAQTAVDRQATVLVAYDSPYPEPLRGARPIAEAFGMAMVLAPGAGERSLARLEIGHGAPETPETRFEDPALERLRRGNPAARSLPLLRALARAESSVLILAGTGAEPVAISVDPIARATRST